MIQSSPVPGECPEPVEVPLPNIVVVDVRLGNHHGVFISSDGAAYTWGFGTDGQLGHGDNSHQV